MRYKGSLFYPDFFVYILCSYIDLSAGDKEKTYERFSFNGTFYLVRIWGDGFIIYNLKKGTKAK